MKKIIFLFTAILFSVGLYAQRGPYSIKGKVTDEQTGETIPGANIGISGVKGVGTSTNFEGEFSLGDLREGDHLIVSFVGYFPRKIPVTFPCDSLVIQLKQDSTMLKDEVIIGYGTAKGSMRRRAPRAYHSFNNLKDERYNDIKPNVFLLTEKEPLSTFALDVDQASYTNIRRMIELGQEIPAEAVRTEEFVNYFTYNYPGPNNQAPLRITQYYTDCPWNEGHRLLMVGLKAQEIPREKLPASNFVFLIDNSGSMSEANRLPLVVSSLKMLTSQLRADDRISIITYGGGSKILLEGGSGEEKEKIFHILEGISADGYTPGQEGIETAYKLASTYFIPGGNNRVILASDGDFNVGASTPKLLEKLIAKKREENIFLTVLGFGMGNYKDDIMQTLAEKGNGNYAYIDNAKEAERIMIGQFAGTAFTLAKDVKIQIEFNPAAVAAYRLIGYESRLLENEDFNNDLKDGGELGVGQTMTAVYEIIPSGVKSSLLPSVDPPRYGKVLKKQSDSSTTSEIAYIKIRYKTPEGSISKKIEVPILNAPVPFENAHPDVRFAAAVIEFAQLISQNPNKGTSSFEHALSAAQNAKGDDLRGERAEFIQLIRTKANTSK